MGAAKKTKQQLSEEIKKLHARVAELEQAQSERRQAEEALCQWTHVFEHAGWGIVVGSADGTTMDMMNPAFARMHGYSVEELIGRSITDVFAPESRAELASHIEIAHQQGHDDFEAMHRRKDGSTFPVMMHMTAIKDESGHVRCRAVHIEDITLRKQEEALLRTQRRLVILLGLTADLSEGLGYLVEATCQIEGIDCASLFLVDRQTGAFDLVSNRGLSPEVIKRSFHFNANTELAHLAMARWSQFWSIDDIAPQELEVLRRSEGLRALAVIPVLHGGRVVAMLSPGSRTYDSFDPGMRPVLGAIAAQIGDLIGRARTEDLLRESQANLQSVLGTVDAFLFVANEEGSIVRINPALRRRLGYYEREIVGASIFKLHPPERQEELRAVITDILAGKSTLCSIPLVAKNGSLVPVETTLAWCKWDDRDALIGLSREVTRRKEAEEALCQANQALQGYRKTLSTVEQAVATDFRTHLSAILGTAAVLENGRHTLSPQEVAVMVQSIEQLKVEMDRVIEELAQVDDVTAAPQ